MAGQHQQPLDCAPIWSAVRGEMKRYEQLAEQIAELIRSGVLTAETTRPRSTPALPLEAVA